MKKPLILFLILIFTGPPWLYGQIDHKVFITENYNIENVRLDDGNSYSRISMTDLQRIDSVGHPDLPVKYIKFIIPSNSIATKIIISKTEQLKLRLESPIEPSQPPIPTKLSFQIPNFVKPVKSIYETNLPYPNNVAEIVDQADLEKIELLQYLYIHFSFIQSKMS